MMGGGGGGGGGSTVAFIVGGGGGGGGGTGLADAGRPNCDGPPDAVCNPARIPGAALALPDGPIGVNTGGLIAPSRPDNRTP